MATEYVKDRNGVLSIRRETPKKERFAFSKRR